MERRSSPEKKRDGMVLAVSRYVKTNVFPGHDTER